MATTSARELNDASRGQLRRPRARIMHAGTEAVSRHHAEGQSAERPESFSLGWRGSAVRVVGRQLDQ